MRQRIGSHLTYANVIATAALFIALGGTAMASLIVTDNSQVAGNTISGHNSPTGDHANVIAGSIDTTDLATGAVTGGRIANNSVTTGKIANGEVRGGDLAPDSVDSSKIADGQVQAADLGANAVDSGKVLDGSLTGSDVLNRGLSDSDIGSPAQVPSANFASVPANSCSGEQLNNPAWNQTGELVFVQAKDGQFGQAGLLFSPFVVTTPGNAFGRLCNVTTAALDPPAEDILAWSLRQ